MRSRVAEEVKRAQRERFALLAPEARAAMARRLGEEWLADIMSAHHLDRLTALDLLRRSRRAGRKPSPSMDGRHDS